MAAEFEQANLFELGGDGIQVTFAATSFSGDPLFSYRDGVINKQFRGREISLEETRLGLLVTVTLEEIPDLRTVSFSIILPTVNVLPSSSGTRIEVPGITATAHTTIGGPGLGQTMTYRQVTLAGTAQFVVS